jgi:hypothetical protein
VLVDSYVHQGNQLKEHILNLEDAGFVGDLLARLFVMFNKTVYGKYEHPKDLNRESIMKNPTSLILK